MEAADMQAENKVASHPANRQPENQAAPNPADGQPENQAALKKGILLVNTGSPDSYNPEDIKRYLKEFLSDRNLIDVPPLLWRIILNAFILPRRPHVTSQRYQDIWTPEGSPLLVYMRSIAHKLETSLNQTMMGAQTSTASATSTPSDNAPSTSTGANSTGTSIAPDNRTANSSGLSSVIQPSYVVTYASRYGNPSVETEFEYLQKTGCDSILSIPLFPQNAFSTTKTCQEKLNQVAAQFPQIKHRCIMGYADNPLYAQAIAALIKDHWNYEPGSKLLFAFHSVPLKHIDRGDTYVTEIEKSMRAVTELLAIPREDWEIAFQSRFEDSRKWVGPNVYTVLQVWAQEKVNRIAVVAPGFSVDCLETLYDCHTLERQLFLKACADEGIQGEFTYIPCLNDSDAFIKLLTNMVQTTQMSWG